MRVDFGFSEEVMAERSSGLIIVLVILLVGLVFVLPMFGMSMMWGPWMMGGGMMGRWGYHPFGWGFMLAPLFFIVLLAVGGYLLLTHRGESADGERALAILNERYARGEITKEQYLDMKEQLHKK
jgi:putative membrane protein